MSKQESYAVLTETDLALSDATRTGNFHPLTVTVDQSKSEKTAEISNKSLPIVNGDTVIWEFFDATTGDHLGDNSVKIVFETLKKSVPGDPDTNSKIGVDIIEKESPGIYRAKYSVHLGGMVLKSSGHALLDDGPTLVIDNMGKPPEKKPPFGPDGDDEDGEGAGHQSGRHHRAG